MAAARLRKKKHAQSLWKKALKADPDFELAEENLDNLKLPQEQVRPPWAWPHYQWFPQAFEQQLHRTSRLQDNDVAMRKFLEFANTLGAHNRYLGLIRRQGDGVAVIRSSKPSCGSATTGPTSGHPNSSGPGALWPHRLPPARLGASAHSA